MRGNGTNPPQPLQIGFLAFRAAWANLKFQKSNLKGEGGREEEGFLTSFCGLGQTWAKPQKSTLKNLKPRPGRGGEKGGEGGGGRGEGGGACYQAPLSLSKLFFWLFEGFGQTPQNFQKSNLYNLTNLPKRSKSKSKNVQEARVEGARGREEGGRGRPPPAPPNCFFGFLRGLSKPNKIPKIKFVQLGESAKKPKIKIEKLKVQEARPKIKLHKFKVQERRGGAGEGGGGEREGGGERGPAPPN